MDETNQESIKGATKGRTTTQEVHVAIDALHVWHRFSFSLLINRIWSHRIINFQNCKRKFWEIGYNFDGIN